MFRLQNGELPNNLNPTVWWLLIGTNDLGEDHCSVESIVAGNLAIIKEIQRRRPDSKIVLNSLLPRTRQEDGSLDGLWGRIVEINRCLEGFAQRMEGVDFFNATNIFLNDEGDIDLDLLPDLLHPSGTGSRLWGKQIVKRVQQMLGARYK
jgi:lysophospholipase L1-like esterase